ncbi:RHS repeat-associated core domain-containing protein [Denitratimonas tolerans]|uniref:RHS repeat-associated core domain-containing protein n=1 Tax=Denitratimonas tolerans TaxID=1338420 RepID=A0AAW9R7Y6_9GAMM
MRDPAPQIARFQRRRQRRRRCSGFTYGNGLIHSRTLNARGLPQRIRDHSGVASRLDYSYGYDRHGNVTSILDGVNANENRSLQYDARDRPIVATAPNIYGEEIYDYDALDNVRRVAGYPNGLGGYVQDHRYQYDASQRLYRIDNELGAQQWGFAGNGFGETYTRTGHGQSWNYQWNAAGRMTRATRYYAGSTWENYVYDTHGHRTRSTRNTGSTRFQVYSRAGQLLYTEDSRDNQRIDYIHLGNKLVAQRSRPLAGSTVTTTWHHTDHIGSANVETNAAGVQTQRTVRMPYGAPYSGVYREGPGFAGHVTDTQTNLTYMQQRYYDPIAQRFLSPDPVDVSPANGSNFNRYWYANNNPYKYRDPDGRYVESIWDAASIAVGVVSLAGNVWDGNWSAAAADVGGIAIDAAALALPVPGGAGMAIQASRQADNAASAINGLNLNKQLASESQTSRILAGEGEAIAGAGTDKALRDAPRLADQYGGAAGDWSKVSGGNHVAPDGTKIETHGYENKATGQIVELKTKLIDEGKR